MDRTSWKPKIFKAEEIVDYKAEEGYGIGTPAGDIIWKYFDEVHRMDQDDVHCKICGKMMTEPVRKAGVAGDGMGGLAQQQVYFDHLKQEHGITESKANEEKLIGDWTDYFNSYGLDDPHIYCKRCNKEFREDQYGEEMKNHLKDEHGITESKASEDDHKKSWDKLDSIAKQGFSDIGYDQKSWDSEPEEVRAEMETVVKDNLGENWKAVANKIYKEELNKGKKSGGESKASEGIRDKNGNMLCHFCGSSDTVVDILEKEIWEGWEKYEWWCCNNCGNCFDGDIVSTDRESKASEIFNPYGMDGLNELEYHDEDICSIGQCPIHDNYRYPEDKGLSMDELDKKYDPRGWASRHPDSDEWKTFFGSHESKANESTIEEEFDNWDLENTGNPYTLSNWVDYALKDNFNEDEVREFWKKKLDGGWARESKANELWTDELDEIEIIMDHFEPVGFPITDLSNSSILKCEYCNYEIVNQFQMQLALWLNSKRVQWDAKNHMIDYHIDKLEKVASATTTESKASEGQLIKIEKNGWEFSVVDHGYGGGWAGTSNTGTYEVGIFEPDDGNPNGQKSEVKGWLTQEEVEDLKRTFEADPVMAYRRIGGDWKEDWQKGLESKASEDFVTYDIDGNVITRKEEPDGTFEDMMARSDDPEKTLNAWNNIVRILEEEEQKKSTEAYGTCNICHKKMNGTGCVGHFEIDGERYSRIGYGEDGNYDEDGCRDCGVKQFGDKHHWNCDNEKCPACRGQALGCNCDDFELIVDGSESMTQMDDSSDSPSTINAARKMMKGQLDSYNDNPTPEGDQYGIPQGFPWQYGGENDFSKKYSYLDKPQVKDEIMPMVDLYHGGQRIGQIRNYNPMGHLGLVTMDAIGIEEYGALPSDYEAYINGKRIPNKWDNQVDHNASFFGENDMKDYEKYDDWDDESEVRNTESWGHWTDNEPMKSHDQVKLMKDLGIADKTLRQMGYLHKDGVMGYLHKDGVEGFIERIEKELSKFGINLDKDKDQVEESKTSAGQLGGGSYLSDSVEDHLDIGIDRWTGKIHREANEDSLIKIEDDKDEDTQVTVLDEWKNETDPDVNGETKGIRTTKASEDASDQCPYCEGKGCEDCLQTGLVDGKLRDVRYPELKTSEGFDQGLYGHVDAKCKTCGIEFDSIPDMDDHYAMHSDHISNLDDLDSNIPNSD